MVETQLPKDVSAWKKLTDRPWMPWVKALFRIEPFSCLTLVFCIGLTPRANAQRRGEPVTKSAQGTLTVTATVVSSLGIAIAPNGEQVVVVANAPAGDNMMAFAPVQAEPIEVAGRHGTDSKSREKRANKRYQQVRVVQ